MGSNCTFAPTWVPPSTPVAIGVACMDTLIMPLAPLRTCVGVDANTDNAGRGHDTFNRLVRIDGCSC